MQHRLHYVVGGNDELSMAERLIVVANVGGPFFGALLESQRAGADRYAVAILELILVVWPTVNEDLVGAAAQFAIDDCAVDHRKRSIFAGFDVSVIARGSRVIEHYGVVRSATDGALGLSEPILPLAAACVSNLDYCHVARS